MFKLFALATLLFVSVSAETEAEKQTRAVTPYAYQNAYHPQNYGAYQQHQPLNAYQYNPYTYDATKYQQNYGAYPYAQKLDAYKYNPYTYDTAKYQHQYGSYPYTPHSAYTGAHAYPYQAGYTHAGYSQQYGVNPYTAGYQHPYSGIYNNAYVGGKQ